MGSAQCSASGCVCPKGDGENAKVVEDRVGAGFVRAAALGPAYIFEDGATYTGQWKGNMRHGYGVHVEADGSKYEGEWIEDKAHGEGRLEHSDGATYDGTWRGSMKHGHGTYIHSDGSKYTGDWLNDLQSGQGTEEWSDGATYSGQYTAGRKNGTGKYAWPNGSHFRVSLWTMTYMAMVFMFGQMAVYTEANGQNNKCTAKENSNILMEGSMKAHM